MTSDENKTTLLSLLANWENEVVEFKGETEYYVKGGGRLPELQIRNKGETQLQRIFAHPEETVVEEFVRILRAGKNEMTKGTNS